MLGAIGTALSGVSLFSKIKGLFGGGGSKDEATILDYEKNASKAMGGSWKDEFLLVIIWIPIIILIWGIIMEIALTEMTTLEGGVELLLILRDNLDMDSPYSYILVLTVFASFGFHINRMNKRFQAARESAAARPTTTRKKTTRKPAARKKPPTPAAGGGGKK